MNRISFRKLIAYSRTPIRLHVVVVVDKTYYRNIVVSSAQQSILDGVVFTQSLAAPSRIYGIVWTMVFLDPDQCVKKFLGKSIEIE